MMTTFKLTRTRVVAAVTVAALGLTPIAAVAQEAETDTTQTEERPERDRGHDLEKAKASLMEHVVKGTVHLERAEALVNASDTLSEVNRRFLLDQIAQGHDILDGFAADIARAEDFEQLKAVAQEMRVTWHKAVLAAGRAHLLVASDRLVDGAQRVDELGDRVAEKAEDVGDPDLAQALIRIGEKLEAAADAATAIALRTADTLREADPQSFEEAKAMLAEARDQLEDGREVLQDAIDALEDVVDARD